jgi:hypothetical protein
MVRRHGEEVDWRNTLIDAMAVYTSGGGKSHGRAIYIYIYYHVCCMYSIFNGIIDSSKVRAQKAAQLSQISGSSYVPRRSKEQLEIIQLKESLRQRDEYYTTCLAQQQAILQVS